MKLQNEYLIIVDKETSPGFYKLCNSVIRFNEFLEDDKEFKIQKNKIFFGKKPYGYQVKRGKVKGKTQNFFYITLEFEGEEKYLPGYKQLLRRLKYIFYENKSIIETLRDDLSFHYSQLSYALIHKIENLMRKFITYFMIINVGKNWINESSPNQIKEVLDKTKRKEYIDVLQQLDFIHLGDFLFKAYHDEDISRLLERIETIDKSITPLELQSYIPKSNWDKYFKNKIDCDDEYLKKRWERLYELRNKIAHTSHFTVGNYQDIQDLVNDIEEKLEQAFIKIDSIEIKAEDKEQLSKTIVVNTNEHIGLFLNEWNNLEKQINRLAGMESNNFMINLKAIGEKGYLVDELLYKVEDNRKFRNILVHGTELVNTEVIQNHIKEIRNINSFLQLSWDIEVKEAFEKLGGEASLNEIYKYIEQNTIRELTASWKSSIRKAIYYYSSDADLYLGKKDLFMKTGKGKWKLRDTKIPAT
ncbi:hypothetical protein [Sulfurimonas sp. NW9]|uniref:hypothetical protein n=1 Tax=Sulfurimonas sp. NW9 TaxID=2922728 RepID=UPI003DA81BC8